MERYQIILRAMIVFAFFAFTALAGSSASAQTNFGVNVRVGDAGVSDLLKSYCSIAVDSNGNIYVVWGFFGGGTDIYLAKSTNSGVTFDPSVRVDDTGATSASHDNPVITVAPNGNIYTVWHDYRNGNHDIYFAGSSDGGSNFNPNVRVDDTADAYQEQINPSITTDNSGNIYVAWMDYRNGKNDIYFSTASSGVNPVFGADIRVDDTGTAVNEQQYPSIATNASASAYVVWQDYRNGNADIYFARADSPGYVFGANVRVDDTGTGSSDQMAADIAVDNLGTVYAVWQDERNGNPDIYLAKSTDGGATFAASVRVDDTGTATSHQTIPRIAVDGSGNIYIVWQDDRNGIIDTYFTKSTDGGATFETNARIGDAGSLFARQMRPDIAVDTNGNAFVAWEDDRNSSIDIYFARSIGQTTPPIADAGDDLIAAANEAVTLDGSGSSDSDGQIVNYTWKRIPDNTVLYSGPNATYDTKALGRVEEVIELTVMDNGGATSSDTMIIVSKTVDSLDTSANGPVLGSIGNPQGSAGDPLIVPVDATDADGDIIEIRQQNLPAGARWVMEYQNPGESRYRIRWFNPAAGTYPNITITASDGRRTDSEIITITIAP